MVKNHMKKKKLNKLASEIATCSGLDPDAVAQLLEQLRQRERQQRSNLALRHAISSREAVQV